MTTSDFTLDTPRTETAAGTQAAPRVMLAPALVTIAFGLVMLFCVGFLQVSAVHNGAHDTRHANGFPCH
jgi:cobalt transporter subunit CbtB